MRQQPAQHIGQPEQGNCSISPSEQLSADSGALPSQQWLCFGGQEAQRTRCSNVMEESQAAQQRYAVLGAQVHALALQKLRNNKTAGSMILLPAQLTCCVRL